MAVAIRRLEEADAVELFDCGDESLNNYLKRHARGLPPYDLPMILLARLAMDRRFSGRGLGRALLVAALKIASSVSEQIGCRAVIVDAYPKAVDWYKGYGLFPIEGSKGISVRMYLDVGTIRSARLSPSDSDSLS